MQTSSPNLPHLGDAMKRIAQRTFVIFQNHVQLLMVGAQEERERALPASWLALGRQHLVRWREVALTLMIVVAFPTC